MAPPATTYISLPLFTDPLPLLPPPPPPSDLSNPMANHSLPFGFLYFLLQDSSTLSPTMVVVTFSFGLLPFLWLVIYRWIHRNDHGPRSWPVIGAVLEQRSRIQDFHDYITEYLRRHATLKVPYPGYDIIYTVDPANVEYMLKTNFSNYAKGKFSHEKQKEMLGDGIFSVDGVEWKQQRKVASYEFSTKALKDFSEDAFRHYASKLANLIVVEAKHHGLIEMQDLFMRMTFDSICKLGFGVETGCLHQVPPTEPLAFCKAFDNANEHLFWRYVDPSWKVKRWLGTGSEAQFSKNIRTLDNFMFNLIERRKRELRELSRQNIKVKPDLLSRFLALSESFPHEYSNRKIRDIILNIIFAGRDTTALTLCWFCYLLSQNPHVEEKLVDEIFTVESERSCGFNSNEEFPSEKKIQAFANLLTYEKLSKMHYLQACLSETLRLCPAVPIDAKIALNSDKLPDGTTVRKGDFLNYVPYAMGRMEWIWGKDAQVFKPERFLKEGIYHQESPYKFTPFQAGPRVCLGKDFAYLQMKVTMAVLLRFFKFSLVAGHVVRYRPMLTLQLSQGGLKMHAAPRKRPREAESEYDER